MGRVVTDEGRRGHPLKISKRAVSATWVPLKQPRNSRCAACVTLARASSTGAFQCCCRVQAEAWPVH